MHNVALVAYEYDRIPEDTMLVNLHGNSKKKKPNNQVMETTKTKLSNALASEKPKDSVDTVFKQKGGLLGAKSAGELPHSRDQAYYLKKKLQNKAVSESNGCSVDALCCYAAMQEYRRQ